MVNNPTKKTKQNHKKTLDPKKKAEKKKGVGTKKRQEKQKTNIKMVDLNPIALNVNVLNTFD